MKLLVTSPKYLFVVDAETRQIALLESHRHEYYGVSWPEDGHELCLGHSGVDNLAIRSMEDYMDSEVGWVSLGTRASGPCLSVPHQILCRDGYIIATNTGRNCLTLVDQKTLFYRHIWIDEVRWDRKSKGWICGRHWNSVMVRGDILYALAHNWERGSQIARLRWPEGTLIDVVPTTAYQAHNLWPISESECIVCDTMAGSLIEVSSKETLWKADAPGLMTRGLATDGEVAFVGMSQNGSRKDRTQSDGGIWILDVDDWRQIDFLPLPNAGNIHEIRILDVPDLCHHGFCYRGPLEIDEQGNRTYWGQVGRRLDMQPSFHEITLTEGVDGPTCWTPQVGEFQIAGSGFTTPEFALAVLPGIQVRDVEISALYDVGRLGVQHVGVVARYRGPGDSNMILAMVHNAQGEVTAELWQNTDGAWSKLASRPIEHAQGKLSLRLIGEACELMVEGAIVARATVPVGVAGSVGLRCLGGHVRRVMVADADSPSQRAAA